LLEKTKAWLARSDPLAAELAAPERAEAERQREAGLQSIERANRTVFECECRRFHIDPAGGVSPSLLRTLTPAELPGDKQ
jgi:hypothetical protein